MDDDSIIIRRKRKRTRRAVDPCLGYYLSPSPVQASNSPAPIHRHEVEAVTQRRTDNAAHIVLPEGTICQDLRPAPSPEPPRTCVPVLDMSRDDDTSMLSVHEFLRQTTAKTVKRYSRRRRTRKMVILGSSNDAEFTLPNLHRPLIQNPIEVILCPSSPLGPASSDSYREESILESDGSPEKARRSAKRQPRRKRLKKSLAQRMHEAAVYSHVDLPDTVDLDSGSAHIATHRPLTFRPVRCATPPTLGRPRRWTTVDPRTHALTLEQATFDSEELRGPSYVDVNLERRPVTGWKPHDYSSPLKIIPQDQKLASLSRSRRLGCQMNTYSPLQFVPLQEHEEALRQKYVPRMLSTAPTSTSVFEHEQASLRVHPVDNNHRLSHCRVPLPMTHYLSPPGSGVAPHREQPSEHCGSLETTEPHGHSFPAQDDSDAGTKQLKTLASLLGGFLETARNASLVQETA